MAIYLAVLFVVAAGSAAAWYVWAGGRYEAFEPHLASYGRPPVIPPEAGGPGANITEWPPRDNAPLTAWVAGPLPGKVVCVDLTESAVHPMQADLPDDLRAATPADVKAVVQIRKNSGQVGEYTTGQKAFKGWWDVSVIDAGTGALIARRRFSGGDPSWRIDAGAGDQTGRDPAAKVAEWLRAAPRPEAGG